MLRAHLGWTQAQLAETAQMTSDEVSRIERGAREPRFATIERLAAALDVPPGRLFDISAGEKPATTTKPQQRGRAQRNADLRQAAERCLRLLQAALKND